MEVKLLGYWPGGGGDTHPLVGDQLIAGVSRMHSVPDPILCGRAFARGIKRLLQFHDGRVMLCADFGDDDLKLFNVRLPLVPLF